MTENLIAAEPCGCTLYDGVDDLASPFEAWSIVLCDHHALSGDSWKVEAYFRAKHPAVFAPHQAIP